jgi:hypothetical protein
LQDTVARELPAAGVMLSESIRALEAYAETRAPARRRAGAGDDEPAAAGDDAGGGANEPGAGR